MIFNYAVWRVYRDYLVVLGRQEQPAAITTRIVNEANVRFARSADKKGKSMAAVEALLLAPLADARIYYTDGSANPNPGPCGAGVYLESNNRRYTGLLWPWEEAQTILELYAVGVALQHALLYATNSYHDALGDGITRPVFILSDSTFAIGCVSAGWSPRQEAMKSMVKAMRAAHQYHPGGIPVGHRTC